MIEVQLMPPTSGHERCIHQAAKAQNLAVDFGHGFEQVFVILLRAQPITKGAAMLYQSANIPKAETETEKASCSALELTLVILKSERSKTIELNKVTDCGRVKRKCAGFRGSGILLDLSI